MEMASSRRPLGLVSAAKRNAVTPQECNPAKHQNQTILSPVYWPESEAPGSKDTPVKEVECALAPSVELSVPSVHFDGVGRVHCVQRLGTGGFGDVWLGRHETDAATGFVAVKFVPLVGNDQKTTPSDVTREVTAHRQLFGDGPMALACGSLLRLIGHAIEAERAVLALELFDGIELLGHVAHQPNGCPAGWLEEESARPIVLELLVALGHMHAYAAERGSHSVTKRVPARRAVHGTECCVLLRLCVTEACRLLDAGLAWPTWTSSRRTS